MGTRGKILLIVLPEVCAEEESIVRKMAVSAAAGASGRCTVLLAVVTAALFSSSSGSAFIPGVPEVSVRRPATALHHLKLSCGSRLGDV